MSSSSSIQTALQPPTWLKRIHSTADIGHANFYPPVAGATEESLDKKAVQEGYQHPNEVPAESYTAKPSLSTLRDGTGLDDIKQLLDLVIERRAENATKQEALPFRPPTRVAFPEARRNAWVKDLANPDIPLQRLSRSVPSGIKGADLLDMLSINNVVVSRAVWFVRVIGANETIGMRNRTVFHPHMYSIDLANVVTAYIKKMLNEIGLPNPQRIAAVKLTFKSILGEPETRQKWLSKFAYMLDLLREFYVESLVDHATFLSWLAQQLSLANLAQAGFVANLCEEYLDGLTSHRVLAVPVIDGCLGKLKEIETGSVKEHLDFLATALKAILQRTFLAVPDAFVCPSVWAAYGTMLQQLFGDDPEFRDIHCRNNALLFQTLPERAMAEARSTMSEIQLLNSVTMDTDLCTIRRPPMSLMLTWAASPTQYGIHRPYLVGTLIAAADLAIDMHEAVMNWLDGDNGVQFGISATRVLGELERRGLFSYDRFVLRALAADDAARFAPLLRDLPVCEDNGVFLRQRKVALFGVRARETEEDSIQRVVRAELRQVLPVLFGGSLPHEEPLGRLKPRLPTLLGSNKFVQSRTVGGWLATIFLEKWSKGMLEDPTIAVRTYGLLSELLVTTHCFGRLCEINILLLRTSTVSELLLAVIGNLNRFSFLYKCMDAAIGLDAALAIAFDALRASPAALRAMQRVLHTLRRGSDVESTTLAIVDQQLEAAATRQPALGPASPEDMSALDQEFAQLLDDPAFNAPSILAHALWSKHSSIPNWTSSALEGMILTLNQIGDAASSPDTLHKFVTFLSELDELGAGNLDSHLADCLAGPIFDELRTADQRVWDTLAQLLLQLVSRGIVSTETLLHGIVYPAWTITLEPPEVMDWESVEACVYTATLLGRSLLVAQPDASGTIPPRCLSESQQLKACRAVFYDNGTLADLLIALRGLASLETHATDKLREVASSVRTALQTDREFSWVVRKNINLVRDIFLGASPASSLLVQMLRTLLGDPMSDAEEEPSSSIASSGLQNITAKVDPWTFSKMSINVHLTLQDLAKGLDDEQKRSQTERDIETFTDGLFGYRVAADETDLLADVLRGISGPVATKFLNTGMQRLRDLLNDLAASTEDETEAKRAALTSISEVLRLLASAIIPLREDLTKLPSLEVNVQDAFVEAVARNLAQLDSCISAENLTTQFALQHLVLVSRALQFSFSVRDAWTERTKQSVPTLIQHLVRICTRFAGPLQSDHSTFAILLDTIALLIDDPKATVVDLFKNVPSVKPDDLPSNMTTSLHRRLLLILPHQAKSPYTDNLIWSPGSPMDDNQDYMQRPVTNRPWEWLENVARDSIEDDLALSANPISIPLALFGGRPTTERVLGEAEVGDHGWRTAAPRASDLVMQQDTFATGSIFESDWRGSRLNSHGQRDMDDAELEEETEERAGSADIDHAAAVEQAFQESSPAPTVLSRRLRQVLLPGHPKEAAQRYRLAGGQPKVPPHRERGRRGRHQVPPTRARRLSRTTQRCVGPRRRAVYARWPARQPVERGRKLEDGANEKDDYYSELWFRASILGQC
ncbi:hypothetical protein BKA62DRAFT_482581 [Auriculariales sp. MPI-PUGE-AT-0066]|nr:hypothetical protein BKA62DRAFT_482581 [Auriculariales sp. MPI-PUGE-AT-0066]